MKKKRRASIEISIAFLDVITCGFGAIILLLMIAHTGRPPEPEPQPDPRAGEISALQRALFKYRDEAEAAARHLGAREAELAALEAELQRIRAQTAALRGETERLKMQADEGQHNAVIYGELKIAQQRLSEEMRRLNAQRRRPQNNLIGGIPVDSEYIVFIIDTSGSMFRYAWSKVVDQIIETLKVYPRVKGIQVMNDMGSYMFTSYAAQWIPDTPARRREVINRLVTWNAFSNSSPVEGIYAAIRALYKPGQKMSLYVYGDEFTGRSIREVVDYVARINQKDKRGRPMVRIHAVGFPVQFANPPHLQSTGIRFAALMRELTRKNGGTFVGLNAFR